MNSKLLWNQFIETGNVQTYIDYKNALSNENGEVSTIANPNRGSCYSGNEHRGSRQTNNTIN